MAKNKLSHIDHHSLIETHLANLNPDTAKFSLDCLNLCLDDPNLTPEGLRAPESRRQVGRKKKIFTLVLEQFYTKYSRNPKKEFMNTYIIRSIKRLFRNAATDKKPTRTCLAIEETNVTQKRCWEKTRKMYMKSESFYNKLSLADGKEMKGRDPSRKQSHSNSFCRFFFKDSRMQKAYFILVDLLFSDSDIKGISKRFKFKCCECDVHYDQCYEKWNELKGYMYRKYFEELGIVVDSKLQKYFNYWNIIQQREDFYRNQVDCFSFVESQIDQII